MGVLSCSRDGCENILCDICISEVGYVCWECKNEFEEYLTQQQIQPTTEGEIKRELKKFMATTKGEFNKGDETTIEEFFKKHTNLNL